MGNDGGSIPKRRELVKEAARNPTTAQLKEVQLEKQAYYWSTDPISLLPLTSPIVSDCSGKLYNKDTILEFLVEGKYKDDAERITQGAVKSLKDVINIHFHVDEGNASTPESWKCPVTGDRLGPGSKAVYLVPCGHAFSGRAIKEIADKKCLTCEADCAPNDIIPLVPANAADVARLSLRIKTLAEQGLTHSLKRASGTSKKRKKKDEKSEAVQAEDTKPGSKSAALVKDAGTKINDTFAASVTAKVVEEQERAKKRKMNDNVSSLFSSRDQSKPIGKSADFMTRGFTMSS